MIKSIIWIIILLIVAYFVMSYFGYEINPEYFSFSKKNCEEKIKECSNSLIHKGLDNAECNLKCIDPGLIIKKK